MLSVCCPYILISHGYSDIQIVVIPEHLYLRGKSRCIVLVIGDKSLGKLSILPLRFIKLSININGAGHTFGSVFSYFLSIGQAG